MSLEVLLEANHRPIELLPIFLANLNLSDCIIEILCYYRVDKICWKSILTTFRINPCHTRGSLETSGRTQVTTQTCVSHLFATHFLKICLWRNELVSDSCFRYIQISNSQFVMYPNRHVSPICLPCRMVSRFFLSLCRLAHMFRACLSHKDETLRP